MTKKELETRVAQLEDAVRWALGEGDSDFGENFVDGKGPFQWRGELRERAGMEWDREQMRSVARWRCSRDRKAS